MKNFLFATIAGSFLLASCNDKPPVEESKNNSKTFKNLEASRAVSKALGSGDVTGIDSAVSANFVDHTDRGDVGRDSLKAMIKMVNATNKDMKMDVIKEIGDDDYVFTWMRFTGTSDGTMMPAGPYNMTGLQVVRCEDGKIVEHWEFMEPRQMMKMMPPPAPAPAAAKPKK
jgi:predicted SnoaL-like aldol condensation-catalyzing enzyme